MRRGQGRIAAEEGRPRGRPVPWKRVFALARPELWPLVFATIFLFASSGLSLAYPLFVGQLVDRLRQEGGVERLDNVVLLLLGLFALMGLATALRSYLYSTAGERIVARLRRALFDALIAQEIGFFDGQRTGELLNRLSSDTTVLQNTLTSNISMGLRFVLMALGSIAVMAVTSGRLTLVMLAVVPLVAVGAGVYGRFLRRVSRKVQDAMARATGIAEEGLGGIRTVRAFAREDHESSRYGEAVEESYQLARKRAALGASFQGLMSFAGYGAIAAVLWYGGRLVAEDALSFGELTAFILYTFTVAFSLGALSSLYGDFAKAIGASERVFELLDRRPEVASGSVRPEELVGRVRFEEVSFAYPTRPEERVLSGFDLELEPGEVVALVGPSGGGKSTVARLLSRFYDPIEGRVLLDGRPYAELDLGWLRSRIGVVAQEPLLFSASVFDNIRYGRLEAGREEVEAAARQANADTFIRGFSEGYDTLVGERGVRLSGGQKQRVAIARAVLKDPSLLILDEATSALDAESEHLIQEALDRLKRGRTTLIIAHRLSTVKDADRVVVLDRGRIAEAGAHDELMARAGLYKKLVERQFAA